MKVIGTTANGVLLEATLQETARVMGYYSERSANCPKIVPGLELQVSSMYSNVTNFCRHNQDMLTKAADDIEKVCNNVRLVVENEFWKQVEPMGEPAKD